MRSECLSNAGRSRQETSCATSVAGRYDEPEGDLGLSDGDKSGWVMLFFINRSGNTIDFWLIEGVASPFLCILLGLSMLTGGRVGREVFCEACSPGVARVTEIFVHSLYSRSVDVYERLPTIYIGFGDEMLVMEVINLLQSSVMLLSVC